uniref:Uncharacterized protein n=1 Tax=Arundo donax TaxID=35708 RepID=A0A0A9GJN8_ARUDO
MAAPLRFLGLPSSRKPPLSLDGGVRSGSLSFLGTSLLRTMAAACSAAGSWIPSLGFLLGVFGSKISFGNFLTCRNWRLAWTCWLLLELKDGTKAKPRRSKVM